MKKLVVFIALLSFYYNILALTNQDLLNFYKKEAENRVTFSAKMQEDMQKISSSLNDLMISIIVSQQEEIKRYQAVLNIKIDSSKSTKKVAATKAEGIKK